MAQLQRKDSDDDLLAGWSSELEALLYSPEVEEAIKEVYPSSNPLDQKDFNPIDYINELFPSEQSLSGIDDRVTSMRVQVQQLDEEIRGMVRGQADSGHDGGVALEEAHAAIQELFGRIRNIKEKAEQSEHMVKKITADIKQMDNAKRHLTDSIRTLERLRFLIANLEQLQINFRQRNYAEVTTQLHGAISVVEEFAKYQSIPQIKQLTDRLESVQYDLSQQIRVDFEKSFSIKGAPIGTKHQLHDACKVMDILGGRKKEELVKWFVRLQLSDYEVMFHESLEGAWLDKVDRRYAWLRRTLVTYEDESQSIFPTEWGIPERVTIQFCNTTRESLSHLMKTREPELDVKLLLFAIQKTTSFEKLLAQRFINSEYVESLNPQKPPEKSDASESEESDDEDGRRRPKKRHLDSPFLGMISRCFEPHLGVYITSQDKALSELLDTFVSDLKSRGLPKPGPEGSGVVLSSAADLFVFYKKCLVQCSSLSTGQPLLELTDSFKKYLREYTTRILAAYTPKTSTTTPSRISLPLRRDTQTELNLSPDELVVTCCILCTADYCLDTTEQLETKLKEKIDKPLKEKMNFSQEQDGFHGIVSSCLQLLVHDMEMACNAAFNAMVKIPWQNVDSVGDSSQYVSTIAVYIKNTIPLLRDTLSSARKYFVNICHKFANAFVPTFITYLYKCKPISTIAAEQLLLDTHSLKTCLLQLPSIGAAVARKAPASYVKLVNSGMERAELIIKVVMSPHAQAEEFISSYTKLMQDDMDINNFQKVLEMKGLKRSEQHVLIELFKTKVTVKTKGADSAAGEKGLIQPIKKLEKLMRF